MALTTNTGREIMVRGVVTANPSAAADKLYTGALVNVNAAGSIVVASDAVGASFAGIVQEYTDAAIGTKVPVIRDAVAWMPLSGAAQANLGASVFATADDTIALTATNVSACGKVIEVDATGGRVLVDFSKAA